MDIAEAAALALCAYSYYVYVHIYYNQPNRVKKPWKRRRRWVNTIPLNGTTRPVVKQFSQLLREPSAEFENFCGMSSQDFDYLLDKISPIISKKDTQLRKSIPAGVRLAIALRFLATGDTYSSLRFVFKVSCQLISRIVPEVCAAINEALKEQIKVPSTAEEWLEIEEGFSKNFPHAVGAVDGKHIALQGPAFSSSVRCNKETVNIVLLALIDSNCRFIYADIGSQGRICEGGVFNNNPLWHQICANDLNLPTPCQLPELNTEVPYVFLGDEAFALSSYVMKPFQCEDETPKRLFNQRLTMSRAVVENTFGALTYRFKVFKKPIIIDADKATLVTMTCVLLHNFLMRSKTSKLTFTTDIYNESGILTQPGSWRQVANATCAIRPIQQIPPESISEANQIRKEFSSYFCKT